MASFKNPPNTATYNIIFEKKKLHLCTKFLGKSYVYKHFSFISYVMVLVERIC